jgi:hypothetical protein
VQVVPATHVPLVLQPCGVLPWHCTWPGAQTPTHMPLTQVWFEHATGDGHWPIALHVSTPFMKHCVVPAAQTPVQTPEIQVALPQSTGLLH